MMKTMSVVMRVVTVFAASCQVSEKPKRGPVTIHRMIRTIATRNVQWLPAISETRFAARENTWVRPPVRFRPSCRTALPAGLERVNGPPEKQASCHRRIHVQGTLDLGTDGRSVS